MTRTLAKQDSVAARNRAAAWIGDAVLLLYSRSRILNETGSIDADKCQRLTSNQFLSGFGEPTLVEARIGQIYHERGLEAAFAYIQSEILPAFDRQEERRAQKPPRGR